MHDILSGLHFIESGILAVLTTATADAIFRAARYVYATGKTLPDNVDTYGMRDAFSGR